MKLRGSRTLETERLILKAQTNTEQYHLWELLMQVKDYCVVTPKKYAYLLNSWDSYKDINEYKILDAMSIDVFIWSVFSKETGECIGYVECNSFDSENPTSDIRGVGWFIDPKYQGKGYGYEAAKAMIDYMFDECEISEIRTYAAIPNIASWKLMEKLGFTKQEQTTQAEYTYIDKPVEAYQYILTRDTHLKRKR